ncbi:type II secretion system protein [Clostridium lacusfryxellense]|uniref:type II secretion system protein n=1 Tax=Clostridium lacusfryxellense TaxID=205328 RepID=UPI001C0D23A4|nr:type II secretion system protein [Clostridium lacusfryxellense]MBU3110247.1 type II secretion system GspH family protein [Clostridium lacusfryxellense]
MNEIIIKKKKKGFTLIELIAVIAILAILGAILVPKIAGYSDSAKKSKAIVDAKIIVNAAAAYNADHETAQIAEDADFSSTSTPATGLNLLVGSAAGAVIDKRPSEFDTTTKLSMLKKIAVAGKDAIVINATTGFATTP